MAKKTGTTPGKFPGHNPGRPRTTPPPAKRLRLSIQNTEITIITSPPTVAPTTTSAVSSVSTAPPNNPPPGASMVAACAPSPFDAGAAIIIYVRPTATVEQVDLIRLSILRHDLATPQLIDGNRVEYLDATQSLAEARRVYANDAAMLAVLNPSTVPRMIKLFATSQATPEALQQLADQFTMTLPQVMAISTPATPNSNRIPLDLADHSDEPRPTLAPLSADCAHCCSLNAGAPAAPYGGGPFKSIQETRRTRGHRDVT